MKKKITFHGMEHSIPLEEHATLKLDKISEIAKPDGNPDPFFVELWLNAHKLHPHHTVELHLKTPVLDLVTHYESTDMYIAIDSVIDKMVSLVKKEKSKIRDKEHKASNDKKAFSDDKYTLS
jgi:ribosomal subunit interface protein